ncbi:MAG: hypothetical protein O2871_02725 [bacterium]|nr:hypothetical protein [bacterium]
MELKFDNRWYQSHEIKQMFSIKEKTWKTWLYGDTIKVKGKLLKKAKQDIIEMGLRKVPGSNYYVVDPNTFQEWFLKQVGELEE